MIIMARFSAGWPTLVTSCHAFADIPHLNSPDGTTMMGIKTGSYDAWANCQTPLRFARQALPPPPGKRLEGK